MPQPATPNDPRTALFASARRLVAVHIPGFDALAVLGVRRARSIDLAQAGFAEIIGVGTAQVMREAAAEERDLLIRLATSDPSTHDQLRAQASLNRQRATDALLSELGEDPQRIRALYDRFEAWIVASVESIGWAVEGIEEGPLAPSASPDTACVDMGGGRRMLPLRFVVGEGRPDQGEFSVKDLSDSTLTKLGVWVVSAFSAVESVRPF